MPPIYILVFPIYSHCPSLFSVTETESKSVRTLKRQLQWLGMEGLRITILFLLRIGISTIVSLRMFIVFRGPLSGRQSNEWPPVVEQEGIVEALICTCWRLRWWEHSGGCLRRIRGEEQVENAAREVGVRETAGDFP